jgi:hypothetical protein
MDSWKRWKVKLKAASTLFGRSTSQHLFYFSGDLFCMKTRIVIVFKYLAHTSTVYFVDKIKLKLGTYFVRFIWLHFKFIHPMYRLFFTSSRTKQGGQQKKVFCLCLASLLIFLFWRKKNEKNRRSQKKP